MSALPFTIWSLPCAARSEMGIAPTPWQDDAVRADLPPGTLGWYAAFMAFGQGAYLLHPTAGSWLLPDAMADAAGGADSGTLVWRIKDAPVHVQQVRTVRRMMGLAWGAWGAGQ